MDKYTVKDFIAYNNPCFSCGEKINFSIGCSFTDRISDYSFLRPTVGTNYVEVDLKISYSDSVRLHIFHKTNKILTNNQTGLAKYLSNRELHLQSRCRCSTEIESLPLDFHLTNENKFLAPVKLAWERLSVTNELYQYELVTRFSSNSSVLRVWKGDPNFFIEGSKDHTKKGAPLLHYGEPTTIVLPLLPKSRFKNREHLIEKVKTYLLFS